MKEILKDIFKMSRKQKGYIYICKYEAYEIEQNVRTKEYIKYGWVTKWKYGKTKNIEQRMKYYGENYTLIESWKVNHLTMREENIRSDSSISDDRRFAMKDARDEHVDFDCYDIVKDYATSTLKHEGGNNIKNGRIHFFDKENNNFASFSDNELLGYIKIK